jgi:hypothetical protein
MTQVVAPIGIVSVAFVTAVAYVCVTVPAFTLREIVPLPSTGVPPELLEI